MKNLNQRLKLLAIGVMASVAFSNVTFAHGEVTVKKKCGWSSNKYKSLARVHKSLILANQVQVVTTCNPCFSVSDGGEASVSLDKCAFQKARYCYGAITSGQTYKWFCSRGNENLLSRFSKYNFKMADDNAYEYSNLNTGDFVFGTTSVSVPNINGQIFTSGTGMDSYLEIRVWVRDTLVPGDSTYTDANTISKGSVGLYNRALVKTGIFASTSFDLITSGVDSKINFSNLNAVFSIPDSYQYLLSNNNQTSKEILISFITHGGGSGEKIFEEFTTNEQITQSNEVLKFEASTDTENNIAVDFVPNTDEQFEINIYSVDGKLLSTLFSGNNLKGQSQRILFADFKNSKGIYLVTYEDSKQVAAKKVSIL